MTKDAAETLELRDRLSRSARSTSSASSLGGESTASVAADEAAVNPRGQGFSVADEALAESTVLRVSASAICNLCREGGNLHVSGLILFLVIFLSLFLI